MFFEANSSVCTVTSFGNRQFFQEEAFPDERYRLEQQQIYCLILNPCRGKHWMSDNNDHFFCFVRQHRIFLRYYVFVNHLGKHSSSEFGNYFVHERHMLEDFQAEKNMTDIFFFKSDRRPPTSVFKYGRMIYYLSSNRLEMQIMIHRMVMDLLKRVRQEIRTVTTIFEYNGRKLASFKLPTVDESSRDCVQLQCTGEKAMFSPHARATRRQW